jgi:hypothetical protein
MKTILLHIRADNGMESRLQAAFDLSRATGAHISCLQIAPLPELVAADLYGSGYLVPEAIDAVRRQDEEMRRALEERLRREGTAWDWHYRSGDLVQGLLETGRLADAMLQRRSSPTWRSTAAPRCWRSRAWPRAFAAPAARWSPGTDRMRRRRR